MSRWIHLGDGIYRNASDTERVERHETAFLVNMKPLVWWTKYALQGRVWRLVERKVERAAAVADGAVG